MNKADVTNQQGNGGGPVLLRGSGSVPVTGAGEALGGHQLGLPSVVGLAARSSVSRCFSANLSAASLFENVASTGPFAAPTLTSNMDPDWVIMYLLMPLIWHEQSNAPTGTA